MNKLFKSLRFIAGCALLGAVVAGVITGWIENPPVDLRAVGAGLGLIAGGTVKALHII